MSGTDDERALAYTEALDIQWRIRARQSELAALIAEAIAAGEPVEDYREGLALLGVEAVPLDPADEL